MKILWLVISGIGFFNCYAMKKQKITAAPKIYQPGSLYEITTQFVLRQMQNDPKKLIGSQVYDSESSDQNIIGHIINKLPIDIGNKLCNAACSLKTRELDCLEAVTDSIKVTYDSARINTYLMFYSNDKNERNFELPKSRWLMISANEDTVTVVNPSDLTQNAKNANAFGPFLHIIRDGKHHHMYDFPGASSQGSYILNKNKNQLFYLHRTPQKKRIFGIFSLSDGKRDEMELNEATLIVSYLPCTHRLILKGIKKSTFLVFNIANKNIDFSFQHSIDQARIATASLSSSHELIALANKKSNNIGLYTMDANALKPIANISLKYNVESLTFDPAGQYIAIGTDRKEGCVYVYTVDPKPHLLLKDLLFGEGTGIKTFWWINSGLIARGNVNHYLAYKYPMIVFKLSQALQEQEKCYTSLS